MKIVKILTILVGMAIILLLGFYGYMGGFSSVAVREVKLGPVEAILYTHTGSYSNLHKSWDEFTARQKAMGLEECDALAFYLDAPETPEEKLRSVLGCRIDALDAGLQAMLKKEFKTYALPELPALHSSFPFRNVLSFFLGPTKVYPEFQKEMKARNFVPVVAVEVYGGQASAEIQFYMPLEADKAIFQPLFDLF